MILHLSVILFTGGCLPLVPGGCEYTRLDRHLPPWADTSLGRHRLDRHPTWQTSLPIGTPPADTPPWQTPPPL